MALCCAGQRQTRLQRMCLKMYSGAKTEPMLLAMLSPSSTDSNFSFISQAPLREISKRLSYISWNTNTNFMIGLLCLSLFFIAGIIYLNSSIFYFCSGTET